MEAVKAAENGEKEKSWAGDSPFQTATQPLEFYTTLFGSLWEYRDTGGLDAQTSSFVSCLCSVTAYDTEMLQYVAIQLDLIDIEP